MSAQVISLPTTAVALSSLPQPQRQPLQGGTLNEASALALMNSHFLIAARDGEIGIYRIEDDAAITFLRTEDFGLLLGNIFVQLAGGGPGNPGKTIPIAKFWLGHPGRRTCRKIVFDPSGNVDPRDYNLWRGFAVQPRAGFEKQRRLLRHIYQIVCRRESKKFNYLVKWLAWAVQNPHRHAEVVVVFKSESEGSGKSTVGFAILEMYGTSHGLLVENKDQLLGTFNAHLETTCFVLGEEVLWAGDHKTADAFKSRVTSKVMPIEAKYR
jgi:hypothetical protein